MKRNARHRHRVARVAAVSALVLFPALGAAALFARLPLTAFVPAATLSALAFIVALVYLNLEEPFDERRL